MAEKMEKCKVLGKINKSFGHYDYSTIPCQFNRHIRENASGKVKEKNKNTSKTIKLAFS